MTHPTDEARAGEPRTEAWVAECNAYPSCPEDHFISHVIEREAAAAPALDGEPRPLREAARAVIDSMKQMAADETVVSTQRIVELAESLAAAAPSLDAALLPRSDPNPC